MHFIVLGLRTTFGVICGTLKMQAATKADAKNRMTLSPLYYSNAISTTSITVMEIQICKTDRRNEYGCGPANTHGHQLYK